MSRAASQLRNTPDAAQVEASQTSSSGTRRDCRPSGPDPEKRVFFVHRPIPVYGAEATPLHSAAIHKAARLWQARRQ